MGAKKNTELTERLKQIIQDSGLPLSGFAGMTGISKNTLVNYRDGATLPASDFLEKVCNAFSVSASWLLLGDGPPYRRSATEREESTAEDYALIPLLKSRVTAGPEGEIIYDAVADHYPFKRWWIEKLVGRTEERRNCLLLIRVRGDSMSPTINQGELALVDTWEGERFRVLPGRIYLVTLPDGAVALKRLVLSGDPDRMRLACLSDNTAGYRPFEFSLDPERTLKNYIMGRVRWVGKEFE